MGYNPFHDKTPAEIEKIFRSKGFDIRGPKPQEGLGGYINPKTNRSYHIDHPNSNRWKEPLHVDVNRPKGYKGPLKKKKYEVDRKDK